MSAAFMTWLLSCSIKAALLLAASWLGAALLVRATAAARHQIWTLGVAGALLLPILCWTLPSLFASPERTALVGSSFDAPAIVVTAGHGARSAPTWPVWLAIAWAAGALVVALRLLRGHLAARRLVRAAMPCVADASLCEAAAALGLEKRIQLLRSETIESPMTIGVLRPRVILPTAAEAWSPERLRAVLVHELGHVRRHDTLIQLAAQLACAVYWWNPLAWLAAARLRTEREHACDDLVLAAGTLPSSYAADLLEVARAISTSTSTAICMVDPSWTEARLRRILDAATPRRPLRAGFRLASCVLALGCAVTIACSSSPPPTAPPRPAPVVSVGAPFVRGWDMYHPPTAPRGSLDLPLVATEVQRHLGTLEACYQRRLAVNSSLAGTVVIHTVITETGKVADACITEDTVGDAEIVACVNQLFLEHGRFPAARGGAVDVSFPFVFTARPAIARADH